jgi:hypothetical protein
MPNLHELLDTASDNLPPLPSLAPTARRIARRRTLATRSVGAALSCALVIGGGTLLIGGLQGSTAAATGAGSSRTVKTVSDAEKFREEAVSALQQIWPVTGEQIKFVGKPDQTIYAAVTPTSSYRVILAFYRLPPNDPENQPHQPCATDTGPAAAFSCSDLPDGHTVAARVGHGMAEFDFTVDDVYSSLTIVGGPMTQLDARKLLTMAKSAIFQQLAADARRYAGVVTPMPGSVEPGATASHHG